jgi:hypothetical protein
MFPCLQLQCRAGGGCFARGPASAPGPVTLSNIHFYRFYRSGPLPAGPPSVVSAPSPGTRPSAPPHASAPGAHEQPKSPFLRTKDRQTQEFRQRFIGAANSSSACATDAATTGRPSRDLTAALIAARYGKPADLLLGDAASCDLVLVVRDAERITRAFPVHKEVG